MAQRLAIVRGGQVRKELVRIALEQESIFAAGSRENLLLRAEKMQFDDYVMWWTIWQRVRALWILSNSRCLIGIDGDSS